MRGELCRDDREVVLRSLDEDVEVEDDKDRENGD